MTRAEALTYVDSVAEQFLARLAGEDLDLAHAAAASLQSVQRLAAQLLSVQQTIADSSGELTPEMRALLRHEIVLLITIAASSVCAIRLCPLTADDIGPIYVVTEKVH